MVREHRLGQSVQGRPLLAWQWGEGAGPATIVYGAFHGDEPATAAVAWRLLDWLDAHPETRASGPVWVMPVVNPDGLEAGTRVNARGVDVNRNFPYRWRSTAASEAYHPGPEPLSEPESRAALAALEASGARKVLSLHAPLHMLNHTGELGLQMAEAMHRCGWPLTPEVGYETPGSFGDYCALERGMGIVTVEFPDAEDADGAWGALRDDLLAALAVAP